MNEDRLVDIASTIIDEFEQVLEKNNITIPDTEREGNEDEARIYGKTYYDLEDNIKNILYNIFIEKEIR